VGRAVIRSLGNVVLLEGYDMEEDWGDRGWAFGMFMRGFGFMVGS